MQRMLPSHFQGRLLSEDNFYSNCVTKLSFWQREAQLDGCYYGVLVLSLSPRT
ncbi:hypothetical protein FOQG_19435 [Fusarium oxysporum f. sp. raphani 54005]|uniref:Uncharacterized protein n=1 Tax=Fusarium oxysporum f. sp. raphani 54005 TaxID=1089458 RepID=X0B115_FUSOX|nr:hypothetical protein FOQG_19435 [Fusarium oxysporum f. sp. raphani 54005]